MRKWRASLDSALIMGLQAMFSEAYLPAQSWSPYAVIVSSAVWVDDSSAPGQEALARSERR